MEITPVVCGPFATNTYIVKEWKECILIDAPAPAETLLGVLEEEKAVPSWVLLTHGHFDHVLALPSLKEHYPALKLAISAADASYLTDNGKRMGEDLELFPPIALFERERSRSFPKIDLIIEEGDLLPLGFKAISTPGHTPGSLCFYQEKEKVLFSGDTLFQGSIGRTDMPSGSFPDLLTSLRRISEIKEALVLPGHGGSTAITQERESNPYF